MMIVKCGRDGLPEFLQREGATQRSAAFVLGESRSTRDVGVQDPPDRTELIHDIRIASFEKADIGDEQVDLYSAR